MLTLLTTAALGILAVGATAQEKKVIRVEENWTLQMGEPDIRTSSPQIGTQMVPNAADPETYAIFCINYQEIPDYSEGGLEIQLWEGDWNTDVTASENVKLSCPGETISWTQVMRVYDGTLIFSVRNGVSSTFGTFGGYGFRVISQSSFTDLNGYSVDSSVDNSGITLGSNRVESMTITSVRKVYSDGSEEIDTTPKVVFQSE
jgi:hypothetical protein